MESLELIFLKYFIDASFQTFILCKLNFRTSKYENECYAALPKSESRPKREVSRAARGSIRGVGGTTTTKGWLGGDYGMVLYSMVWYGMGGGWSEVTMVALGWLLGEEYGGACSKRAKVCSHFHVYISFCCSSQGGSFHFHHTSPFLNPGQLCPQKKLVSHKRFSLFHFCLHRNAEMI